MVPKKIQPYFKTKDTLIDNIIQGNLLCCGHNNFSVQIFGEIHHSIFNTMQLLPINNEVALHARCVKCGNVLPIFNSISDGYDQCDTNLHIVVPTTLLECKKCHHNDFSIKIRYEYPEIEELNGLGIVNKDNAFTWIWITIECNHCGKKYKNFIDYETG